MHDYPREIRTPHKNLLIGTILKEDNDLILIIKSRGKTDYIAIEMLLANIYQYDSSEETQNECN